MLLPVTESTDFISSAIERIEAVKEMEPESKAAELHDMFVQLGKIAREAGRMIKAIAITMWEERLYTKIRIGDLTFDTFQDWVDYAVKAAGLSDQSGTAIQQFLDFVVDPIAKGLVTRPDGSQVTVDDALNLPEWHAGRVASTSKALFENEDPNAGEAIGVLFDVSEKDRSRVALTDTIRKINSGNRMIPPADGFICEIGGKTVFAIVASDERQRATIMVGLNGRAVLRTSDAEDVVKILSPGDQHEAERTDQPDDWSQL